MRERKDSIYVLVTPARNEVSFIEQTILSVVSQSVLPVKWVIVSDGSTDGTDEIVMRYADKHPWIELVRMPERRDRNFAAKVGAFNAGYERLRGVEYDYIGSLDADITFDGEYFEFLLNRLLDDQKLGVVGTPFVETDGSAYDYSFTNIEHVSGACQLFRKACFEEVGGYAPIKGGGIDWVAVTTARMKGWKTRTFVEKTCQHHRKMGTGNTKSFLTNFKHGKKDYFLGGHPVWQLFRSLYQATRKPYVLGGMSLLSGYAWAWMTREPRRVGKELMQFNRQEQMRRLSGILKKLIGRQSTSRRIS